ncbi:MAG: sensor histidine kinase, partial [Lachnospiraceae bacterium]|nr:sensor histidine kinase [Lachnospiraceae bacterium]
LYTQLLQEKETDPELVPIVTNIKEQSEKLDFLIRSLVKASRLESEVLMLNPKQEAIMPCIRAAAAGAEEAAALKEISLIIEETDAKANYDRKWTEEAIGNLLDNAIKYSSAGSEVRVRVTEYEMFAAVSVTDSGIGIREEEQAQIFERFYRSAEVAEEKGVGIGLYLVREIAAKQGGYVRVKSKHGAGSTFSLYMAK